jgi:hypothetical protein
MEAQFAKPFGALPETKGTVQRTGLLIRLIAFSLTKLPNDKAAK